MDLYEFVELCKAEGMSATEAENEWSRQCCEAEQDFLESYYNDASVQYGWYQQDLIDMRRRER